MHPEKSSARPEVYSLTRRQRHLSILVSAMIAFMAMVAVPVAQAAIAGTTTTLALSPSSPVASGTVVTLTASVVLQSNSSPVTTGRVTFCDLATAIYCENSALIGTAQLASGSATAVIKLIPGIGSHSYVAVFDGTPNGTLATASSTSTAQALTVTGTYATTTAISLSGSAGNYTLTGTVVGMGSSSLFPTGMVSFFDVTNGNSLLGSATLGAATLTQAFGTEVPYVAGNGSDGIAVGDFNGDGIPDLAVTNSYDGTVSVLLGKGDGTFPTLKGPYATGNGIPVGALNGDGVAVGDFNGDGIADLVVSNFNSGGVGTVSVLLGNGDGTFQQATTYDVGTNPYSVIVADFNGDGIADLATANWGDSTVSVLLGNGNGTFQTAKSYNVGTSPHSVAVGDFNGDGIADLVAANFNQGGAGTVSVLLGNGDGTFQTQVSYTVGSSPTYVAVGDFNGDGIADLVVTNSGDDTVSVLLGNGNGTFSPTPPTLPPTYATGPPSQPWAVVIGDFNGDGNADLAVTNYNNGGDGTVSVLLGKGDGTFGAAANSAVGSGPTRLAVGDFSGGGIADLAVANLNGSTVSVLLNSVMQTAMAVESGVSVPGAGPQQVNASYAGDSNFGASSTSSTIPLNALPAATTLALKANLASSTYGQSVVLTGTLSPYAEDTVTTSGETVSFKNGSTLLGTGTLNSSGVATLTLPTLPTGTNSLTAVYAGDANFAASASTALGFTVSQASLTITASSGTMTYGGTPPTVTPSYSGFVGGDTSASLTTPPTCSTTATSSTPAGTDTGADICSGAVDNNYTINYVAGNVTVNKATPVITWAAPAAITAGTALSSTQLDATASVPGTFVYNPAAGTTPAAGTDTLSVTFTPTDKADYNTATATVSLAVEDFSFNAASGSSTSATVAPGSPANYTLSLAGEGGFSGQVSFACTGAPSEATCTVASNPVTVGSSATNVTVTVATTAASGGMPRSRPQPPPPSPGVKGLWMLALALALVAWTVARRNQLGVGRWRSTMLPFALGSLLILALAGCGGGGGPVTPPTSNPGTPAGTYPLTVKGTAGSGSSALTHSVTLTLTVS